MFWKLYRRFRVWKALTFYGVDLVFMTPEEMRIAVPSEAHADLVFPDMSASIRTPR